MVALEAMIELEDKLAREYEKACELADRGIYTKGTAKLMHHCLKYARELYQMYILTVGEQVKELKEGAQEK